MKLIVTCFLCLFAIAAFGQSPVTRITTLFDSRVPEEVKNKLRTITTPEELVKFHYTSTSNVMSRDTPSMTIKTVTSFSFDDGKIIGSIKVSKNNIGYTNEVSETPVELCYIYCCKDKTGKENCTQNFDQYKQWMKHPENCLDSRTTSCQ
ncbi:MAG TPA: hypothetical protein VGN20_21970 [Mucilaginibacter sp.]|jgi:hypothetical protein